METKLKKLVLEGFYHEAENVMLTIPLNAQRDIIMNLAFTAGNTVEMVFPTPVGA